MGSLTLDPYFQRREVPWEIKLEFPVHQLCPIHLWGPREGKVKLFSFGLCCIAQPDMQGDRSPTLLALLAEGAEERQAVQAASH